MKFISGDIDIIISTIAFGMGIDQIVKCILIFGCPKSIEEYYQQIGRGGRDGKLCETVLFFDKGLFNKYCFMIKKESNHRNKIDNLNKMKDYFDIKTCRRRYILEYLGYGNENYFSLHTFTCTNCDNCDKTNKIGTGDSFLT